MSLYIIIAIMQRLAALVRAQPLAMATCVRGPKKKGQAEVKIESTDIINIFKERQDPEPRDIRTYPLFVQQMSIADLSIYDLMIGAQNNISYMKPSRAYYKAFLRGMKRQRFKCMREFKQLDLLPLESNEKFDVGHREAIYDFFSKTKEQIAEEEKIAAAEMAALEEEDDDI